MNILVIGNGFDLAHGLPTKYEHFLKFIQTFKECYQTEFIDVKDITMDSDVKKYIGNLFNCRYCSGDLLKDIDNESIKDRADKLIHELYILSKDNVWIDYYLGIYKERAKNGKDGWIDFENEISQIIRSITDVMTEYGYSLFNEDLDFRDGNTYTLYQGYVVIIELIKKYNNIHHLSRILYLDIRNNLLSDLNRLIRILEIYLTDYVEKMKCRLLSPDIQSILPKGIAKINGVPVYDTYILSFNYTNTYQKMYIDKQNIAINRFMDYIHGKAERNNNIESNNMVLGIDEYLDDDRKNKDIEFLAFKKYYQRIYKQTGCEYKKWVDQIKYEWDNETEENRAIIRKDISNGQLENKKIHKLYIFGHSLDETDKDILCDLILNDNVHTTIFYHKKDVMGQLIANLVKVIGQDELIKRTGGSTKTIEFKLQQGMVEIEDSTT